MRYNPASMTVTKERGVSQEKRAGLSVDTQLVDFVEDELLNGLKLSAYEFWEGLASLIADQTSDNRKLLAHRDKLQQDMDAYHREHPQLDHDHYVHFLKSTGYIEPEVPDFTIRTENVDPEIATTPGPQLVVPVSNARFALNAANARWGSLYDALYGTDVIDDSGGKDKTSAYNPTRGAAVIDRAAAFLDEAIPLANGRHADVSAYQVKDGALGITLESGADSSLKDPEQWLGYRDDGKCMTLLFVHHGLHLEVQIDPQHPIGKTVPNAVADVILESAVTAIQDCEDSVAAVDAEDKVNVYRNWLGLMKGDLSCEVSKGGRSFTRKLHKDRHYTGVNGEEIVLPGRSLMLVRNVGHLMTNSAVYGPDGVEIFEGLLDALVTTTAAMHDFAKDTQRNARENSVYIVKPKMHGSAEAAFTNRIFSQVEDILGLPRNTIKVGVMDEERRTTVNLKNCIEAVADRLVFINTGFLDRTGDEIHTSMLAGPMLRKDEIKQQPWISAYEDWNVDVGIRCGLRGKAQIGKGMWAKPDEMAEMMATKHAHPLAGANCAWVPSPTAATLHAMHYHQVDVLARQAQLAQRPPASLDDILTIPLAQDPNWTDEEIQAELDNNIQGILGYVVRWIDFGVGCSKVPDIHDVGLMEDRATLRISSQHIANWLQHGICSEEQVRETFERMAGIVDQQNSNDPSYRAMADDFDDSIAFQAACALVFKGTTQPNGYTEPLLHAFRRKLKNG